MLRDIVVFMAYGPWESIYGRQIKHKNEETNVDLGSLHISWRRTSYAVSFFNVAQAKSTVQLIVASRLSHDT